MSGDEITSPPDDGQPFDPYYTEVEPTAVDPGGVWANRRVRNGLIAAGVIAAAVLVIGVNEGGSGDADSALRSRQEQAATTTTTTVNDRASDGEDEIEVVTRSLDGVTTPGGPMTYDEFTDDTTFDDEFTYDTTYDDEFFDDEISDDEFFSDFFSDDDESFFDDDDFFNVRPSTGNRNRLTPRVPFVPRATTTTTEPEDETTTTEAEDTTTSSSTTTSSTTTTSTTTTTTTTTTLPPAVELSATWPCASHVELWTRPGGALLGLEGHGLFVRDTGDTKWIRLVDAAVAAGNLQAYAAPASGTAFWVGGSGGVFRVDGTTVTPVPGAPTNVVSLAASSDGNRLLAATTTTLQMSTAGAAFADQALGGVEAGSQISSVVVDGDIVLLGTSTGVYERIGSGSFTRVETTSVVGDPVVGSGTITWLQAGGQGLVRRTAGIPPSWTSTDDGEDDIAPAAPSLVLRGTDLITVGSEQLVVSTDGGASWSDMRLPTDTPYQPAGVARGTNATFVWPSACTDQGRAADILRLPDPPA